MVSHSKVAALLIIATASSAHAWEVVVRVSLEVTCRGTSETTSAASSRSDQNEERRQDRLNQYSQSSDCRTDSDCQTSQYCEQGRCVQQLASAPVQGAQPIPGCSDDSQCAMGYACFETRCVERSGPQLPPVQMQECSSALQCVQGQSCVNGRCMSPPPSPPSSSLQRRGTEIYLRERGPQLRQDLALGEGPVLNTLALTKKVPAKKLGSLIRANRSEFIGLVGDGSDTNWPGRFLEKVDQLLAERG